MKPLLISIILALFLTGCAGVKKIETLKVAVQKTPLNLEMPEPLESNEVTWIVINIDNYKQVFEENSTMCFDRQNKHDFLKKQRR